MDSNLEVFLKKVIDCGGIVREKKDENGFIDVLAVITQTMLSMVKDQQPSATLIDTTFKTNSSNYKLMSQSYCNIENGRTAIAGIALLADESDPNIEFVFKVFAEIHVPKAVLVDKDLHQIDALGRIFGCRVLLCWWHVQKYLKKVLATCITTVPTKEKLSKLFKDLMYSKDENEYQRLRENLSDIAADLTVQISQTKEPTLLTTYVSENWDSCKEMWVKYHRSQLNLMGDNTTNRMEGTFSVFKSHLKNRCCSNPSPKEVLPILC